MSKTNRCRINIVLRRLSQAFLLASVEPRCATLTITSNVANLEFASRSSHCHWIHNNGLGTWLVAIFGHNTEPINDRHNLQSTQFPRILVHGSRVSLGRCTAFDKIVGMLQQTHPFRLQSIKGSRHTKSKIKPTTSSRRHAVQYWSFG